MITAASLPTVGSTEVRFQARAELRGADAAFADAVTHLAAQPLDEVPDANGPFGAACSAARDGIDALTSAVNRDTAGTAFDNPAALSALVDANAALELLGHWEANGWSPAEAAPTNAILRASTRLLVSARSSISDALVPTH
jgi:hypothetical protein